MPSGQHRECAGVRPAGSPSPRIRRGASPGCRGQDSRPKLLTRRNERVMTTAGLLALTGARRPEAQLRAVPDLGRGAAGPNWYFATLTSGKPGRGKRSLGSAFPGDPARLVLVNDFRIRSSICPASSAPLADARPSRCHFPHNDGAESLRRLDVHGGDHGTVDGARAAVPSPRVC